MKKYFLVLLFIAVEWAVNAQDLTTLRYDTDLLPASFHLSRREEVRKQMPDNSIAVIFSAPVRNRSNDDDYQYHQSPGFYYLTGCTEPNSMLVITKDKKVVEGEINNEFLFVQSRNPAAESWTGRRLGIEGAKKLLGFSTVFISGGLDTTKIDFRIYDKILILPYPQGIVADKFNSDDLSKLISNFKQKTEGRESITDDFLLDKILDGLREVKQPEEMKLQRKAIDISADAHVEMMKSTNPGMHEYEVQAVGEYVFKKNGSEYVGYPSICGGGENTCILHYESNRRPLKNGDLILLDMGAEYHGYSADVTRTIPVNGKFSAEQKLIYELVLQAQDSGIAKCLKGNSFSAPHQAAKAVLTDGLIKLGIIKSESEVRKYFMHGTSHYLGLDVHDAGTYTSLKPGNVITVEPGIYIPEGSDCDKKWWNIGVRIEDDILITDSGYEILSAKAPRTVADIEKTMAQKSSVFIQK